MRTPFALRLVVHSACQSWHMAFVRGPPALSEPSLPLCIVLGGLRGGGARAVFADSRLLHTGGQCRRFHLSQHDTKLVGGRVGRPLWQLLCQLHFFLIVSHLQRLALPLANATFGRW